jgi:hypothetical protein
LSIEQRTAVKGGSEDPREEEDESDADVAVGDDMASFGTIGFPIEFTKYIP